MTSPIPTYFNKKGKEVKLSISRHAVKRFAERSIIAFPEQKILNSKLVESIVRWFSTSNKIKNLSRQDKTRINRYGKDTMFFRTNAFTFIVQNATIVTIELSDKKLRCFN